MREIVLLNAVPQTYLSNTTVWMLSVQAALERKMLTLASSMGEPN